MIEKPLTIARRFFLTVISPDVLGVSIVGFLIVWLVGIPFESWITQNFIQRLQITLGNNQYLSPFLWLVATIAIVSLVIFILFWSKRLFVFLVAAFVMSWFFWSGVVQNYSQLPWWRLFEIDLPTPQFIADRTAKLFILIFGSWVLMSLHRFRFLRQELQRSGIMIEDLQKISLFSTFILIGSALVIGGITYASFLLFL